jgi:hypothetical protein
MARYSTPELNQLFDDLRQERIQKNTQGSPVLAPTGNPRKR